MADVDDVEKKDRRLKSLGDEWASSISRLLDGVDNPVMSLSNLRVWIGDKDEETRQRLEKEIEDTEFHLKRGSDLGRFDQFWEDDTLFDCRYIRSKWLDFIQNSTVPLEVYSHALKGNKNITHISFFRVTSDFVVNRFLFDLPWVTSISLNRSVPLPAVSRDFLFIKSITGINDLNTFAKEIKLVPSTYIFSDVGFYASYSGFLRGNGRVLISFIAPTSGKSLTLRVKHSGKGNAPLEVTLGSTKIQLNPSSKSSLTIDDITLNPIQVSGPFESDQLSFEPEVRNDIFTRFIGYRSHGHFLHDIELLDEGGLEYMPRSTSLSKLSN